MMDRIGLSFDEFVELELTPRAGADAAMFEAAELERQEMFPMKLVEVNTHLRSRGYDCRPMMLQMLIKNKVVKPADPDAWTPEDVEAAATHFEACDIHTPYALMCKTLGCTYAGYLRPLREAAVRESAKFGRRIPNDDQYFVMHRQPPRENTPAIITFTLSGDVQERIERGEEV
jgi:hypothetical protein